MRSMLFAIFFKEYTKTRTGIFVIIAAGLCLIIAIGLGVHRLFLLDHPEIVWYHTMDLHQIPYQTFAYLPVLSAIAFCLWQFLPEMRDERMRIALHLPCPLWLLMLAHISFGLIVLTLLFCAETAAIVFILASKYPPEAITRALETMLPWSLAGIYSYLCTAWLLLEPKKRTRLLGPILGLGICWPLLSPWQPGSFVTALPPFLLGIPLLMLALFLPALHFRTREVE